MNFIILALEELIINVLVFQAHETQAFTLDTCFMKTSVVHVGVVLQGEGRHRGMNVQATIMK